MKTWFPAFAGMTVLLLFPGLSNACTVCFGGVDSQLERGFFWGIIVLGSLPYTLLASFVGYLYYSHRKKKAHSN